MSYPIDLESFEVRLDAAFDQLPCWSYDGELSIVIAAQLIERSYRHNQPGLAGRLQRGLYALMPRLIRQSEKTKPDFEALLNCLVFGSHYYELREYLYYSYNAAGSCSWEFKGERIEVRYSDRTITRQFLIRENNFLMGSVRLFRGYSSGERIEELLRDKEEFALGDHLDEVERLLKKEADMKLSAYFSIISPSANVSLGPYSYSDYYKFYRALVMKALYHRYHARANGPQSGSDCIFGDLTEFVSAMAQDLETSKGVVEAMLADAAYSVGSSTKRIQPMNYPLIRLEQADQYMMPPIAFSLGDGLVNILRIRATVDPKNYLRHVAPAVDQAFVETVAKDFERQGFSCKKNLSLQDFDKSLPDIDLLVISFEPTLGFYLYVCELKAPIPASWSKDDLKALQKDGVSKAFIQVQKIMTFLRTETGIQFLRGLLPAEGIPHFGQEFVLLAHAFVITSDNAGMFFGDKDVTVIEYRTLRHILETSDGDVPMINWALKTFPEIINERTKSVFVDCEIDGLKVSYEGVYLDKLLAFEQHQYRSTGLDKEIAKNFIEDGHHPYDCLREKLNHLSSPEGEQVSESPAEQPQAEKEPPREDPAAGDGKLRARRPEA
jgi:hypothetical protein